MAAETINISYGTRFPFVICGDFNHDLIAKCTTFFQSQDFKNFMDKVKRISIAGGRTINQNEEYYLDIYLHSNGGDLNIAILLFEIFKNTIKKQLPALTVVIHFTGYCDYGAILFAGIGDIRVLYPNTMMIFRTYSAYEPGRETKTYHQKNIENIENKNNLTKKYYGICGYEGSFIEKFFLDDNDKNLTHDEILQGKIATHVSEGYYNM